MDRILVGVDGSPASTAAAVWAAGEAAMRNVELTIVHVPAALSDAARQTECPAKLLCDDVTNVGVAQGAEAIDGALDAVTKGIDWQPPRITCKLCIGPVVPTLWEFTQQGARMIVLGRHGGGKTRRALGSVTDEMLQTARCPVTVVPHEPVSQTQASRAAVVVGVNISPASQLAIAVAFDEAARRKTQLVAIHAATPAHRSATNGSNAVNLEAEYVWAHALADWQLRYPNVDVRRLVTRDDPVKALLKHSRRAQLVVVGGGRRTSVVTKPFGGVSSAVAQASRIPVIVARRKPSVCQPETIGDLRKPGGLRQIR